MSANSIVLNFFRIKIRYFSFSCLIRCNEVIICPQTSVYWKNVDCIVKKLAITFEKTLTSLLECLLIETVAAEIIQTVGDSIVATKTQKHSSPVNLSSSLKGPRSLFCFLCFSRNFLMRQSWNCHHSLWIATVPILLSSRFEYNWLVFFQQDHGRGNLCPFPTPQNGQDHRTYQKNCSRSATSSVLHFEVLKFWQQQGLYVQLLPSQALFRRKAGSIDLVVSRTCCLLRSALSHRSIILYVCVDYDPIFDKHRNFSLAVSLSERLCWNLCFNHLVFVRIHLVIQSCWNTFSECAQQSYLILYKQALTPSKSTTEE